MFSGSSHIHYTYIYIIFFFIYLYITVFNDCYGKTSALHPTYYTCLINSLDPMAPHFFFVMNFILFLFINSSFFFLLFLLVRQCLCIKRTWRICSWWACSFITYVLLFISKIFLKKLRKFYHDLKNLTSLILWAINKFLFSNDDLTMISTINCLIFLTRSLNLNFIDEIGKKWVFFYIINFI